MIRQGDIYWSDLGEPWGSEPGYIHPLIVIQNDVFNQSRIDTVVTCVITTNLSLAAAPGNVLLEIGEANLPKASVVNVSQIVTVDRAMLGELIGHVTSSRLNEVLNGIIEVIEPA